MVDIDNMSKDELLELRDSLVGDSKTREENQLNPKIQMAVDMLRITVINSRKYAESVDTEEKRQEQINRIQKALDRADYLEASAFWSPESNKSLR